MSVYNDGESQLRSIPQSTPSLKDEIDKILDKNIAGDMIDTFGEAATEILDLVISRVLDEISGVIADTTIPTYERAEAITSAIKGLKG